MCIVIEYNRKSNFAVRYTCKTCRLQNYWLLSIKKCATYAINFKPNISNEYACFVSKRRFLYSHRAIRSRLYIVLQ